MKLNPLLLAAALLYALAGLPLIFAPVETLGALGIPSAGIVAWLAQLLGGALFGLALLNWLQRYSVTGGILGRPLLVANLPFVTVAFFASLSSWRHDGGGLYLVATVLLGLLTAAFGLRFFRAPSSVG